MQKMEEYKVRSDLERLETSIDRLNAEFVLRVGLVGPAVIVTQATFFLGGPWEVRTIALSVTVALVWQAFTRRMEVGQDIRSSTDLRAAVAQEIERDPDVLNRREAWAESRNRAEQRQREEEELVRPSDRSKLPLRRRHSRRGSRLRSLSERESELDATESDRLSDLRDWKADLDKREADRAKRLAEYTADLEARQAAYREQAKKDREAREARGSDVSTPVPKKRWWDVRR